MNEEAFKELKLVPLDNIKWKLAIREFTAEDVQEMGASLKIHGQIQPIICMPVDKSGIYEGVCGRLRYEGAKQVHLPEILVRVHAFKDDDEVLDWQLVENLHRKELTTIQRSEAYKQLYDLRRKEMRGVKDKNIVKGIVESIEKFSGEKKAEDTIRLYIQIAKDLPETVKNKIRLKSDFGLAHSRQFLRLKDEPKAQLKLIDEFVQKPITVHRLKRKVTKILAPKPTPLPEGEFNVIYADPPWEYEQSPPRGDPQKYYPVMTLEEICKLKVPTNKDAVLFLWATNPKLKESLEVVEAWGFNYRTNIVWVKDKIGTGFYVRGKHELLLIAKKGKLPMPEEADRPASVVTAPRKGHSEKPDVIYEIIERMYPKGKCLELFARKKRIGWETWGNV